MVSLFRGRYENRQEQLTQQENRNGHLLPGIENEFRELVRRRGVAKADSGNGAGDNLNSLTQSVSGPVVLEIEKLIVQLQDVRDHLVNEGQRVQRAVTEYAQMSEAASKSTKIIAEGLARWGAENGRADRGSAVAQQIQSERSAPPAVDANHANSAADGVASRA
jgi:hypothetical protein